jgi:hypothetical protein
VHGRSLQLLWSYDSERCEVVAVTSRSAAMPWPRPLLSRLLSLLSHVYRDLPSDLVLRCPDRLFSGIPPVPLSRRRSPRTPFAADLPGVNGTFIQWLLSCGGHSVRDMKTHSLPRRTRGIHPRRTSPVKSFG